MKKTFATCFKCMNTNYLKIVGLVFLLMVAFNFLQQKMPQKWYVSSERTLVRDLQSVEISPIANQIKPKPQPPIKQVFVNQKTIENNNNIQFKDSLVQQNRPLVKPKKSKFSPASLQASANQIVKKDNEPSLMMVEEMPRFPGCEAEMLPLSERQKCAEKKMLQYIRQNIDYPKAAMAKGIQGIVYIQFVVEKNGHIANVKIIRDIGGDCGKEAKRVVQSMPHWTPGKQGGNPTSVQFNLPVKFRL